MRGRHVRYQNTTTQMQTTIRAQHRRDKHTRWHLVAPATGRHQLPPCICCGQACMSRDRVALERLTPTESTKDTQRSNRQTTSQHLAGTHNRNTHTPIPAAPEAAPLPSTPMSSSSFCTTYPASSCSTPAAYTASASTSPIGVVPQSRATHQYNHEIRGGSGVQGFGQ